MGKGQSFIAEQIIEQKYNKGYSIISPFDPMEEFELNFFRELS